MSEEQFVANDIDTLIRRANEILLAGTEPQVGEAGGRGLSRDAKITSDGSTRLFVRVRCGVESLVLAAPATRSKTELAEANAAQCIGRHLFRMGVAVPQIHCYDPETGMLLFEDLGETRLYDLVAGKCDANAADITLVRQWYRKAIDGLLTLQVKGAVDFQRDWCWDTSEYDRAVMLEKESGYFLRAFWVGMLDQPELPGVAEEFIDIARMAGKSGAGYFLHRDCQSRNIMVRGEDIIFIDFQGGRLGPLGYDLASLMIDPYVSLSAEMQDELVGYYRQRLADRWRLNDSEFVETYKFLALQRNLQIIGAFAFLSTVRQKKFFSNYLKPALYGLRVRLEDSVFADYHQLRKLVNSAESLLVNG